MNIFRKVPYDIQCLVVKKLDVLERRRLSWNIPLTLQQCYYYENILRRYFFVISATIWCDRNGFIWMNTNVKHSLWLNEIYNLKNVPLCSALTHSPKHIARLFKRVFFEFVNHVHYYGKCTYRKRIYSNFELVKNNDNDIDIDSEDYEIDDVIDVGYRLKTKDIQRWIKKEWFSNIGEKIFESGKKHALIPQFCIKDGILNVDIQDTYMPYSTNALSIVELVCPYIFKCLEQFGELKCPLLPMTNPLRQYIYWHKRYEKYRDDDNNYDLAVEATRELIMLLRGKFKYNYQLFPPSISEIFEYSNMFFLVS